MSQAITRRRFFRVLGGLFAGGVVAALPGQPNRAALSALARGKIETFRGFQHIPALRFGDTLRQAEVRVANIAANPPLIAKDIITASEVLDRAMVDPTNRYTVAYGRAMAEDIDKKIIEAMNG